MTTAIARRGFLGTLAALPVFAREATKKAGIDGLNAGQPASDWAGSAVPSKPPSIEYFIRETKKVMDPAWGADPEMVIFRLDADIASSRSFSLSAAVNMQRRRNIERYRAREINNLERWAKDALGVNIREFL